MAQLLWRIILGYVFVRPFVCGANYAGLSLGLDTAMLVVAGAYLARGGQLHFPLVSPGKMKLSPEIRSPGVAPLIYLFLLSMFISAVFSGNTSEGLVAAYRYVPLAALFFVMKTADEGKKRELISVLALSALLICVLSLYYTFIVSDFASKYLSANPGYRFAQDFLVMKRAHFPFLTANLLAGYLVMVIMLVLGAGMEIKRPHIIAGFVVVFVTLFLTKSIGGWVILLICALIFSIIKKAPNTKILVTVLLLLLAIAAVYIMRLEGDGDFTKPFFSFEKRLSYWKGSAAVIAERPWTGIGMGNLSLEETKYAHNSYLQIWAEAGLLGIMSWLALVFLFIKKGFKNRTGAFTAGVAFLLHNIIDFSFFIPEAAFLWWVVLGIAYSDS